MLESLIKATVGAVIETPIAVVKDAATMGGALTDQETPYTVQALEKVSRNVADATEPKGNNDGAGK